MITTLCSSHTCGRRKVCARHIKNEDLIIKSKNAQSLWDNTYVNYTENFLQETYLKII
mgnify:CR=1 FL=1